MSKNRKALFVIFISIFSFFMNDISRKKDIITKILQDSKWHTLEKINEEIHVSPCIPYLFILLLTN